LKAICPYMHTCQAQSSYYAPETRRTLPERQADMLLLHGMTTPNQPCVKRRDVRGVLLLIAAFRSSADDSSSETKNRP
jgi:hypothetical protein